jgi:hypothetical protein
VLLFDPSLTCPPLAGSAWFEGCVEQARSPRRLECESDGGSGRDVRRSGVRIGSRSEQGRRVVVRIGHAKSPLCFGSFTSLALTEAGIRGNRALLGDLGRHSVRPLAGFSESRGASFASGVFGIGLVLVSFLSSLGPPLTGGETSAQSRRPAPKIAPAQVERKARKRASELDAREQAG